MVRTRWAWVFAAALVVVAASLASAEDRPWFPPIQGTLYQSATSVQPLERVIFEASATDRDEGRAAGGAFVIGTDPLTFSWQASGGQIVERSPATAVPNRIVWVAPALAGQYQVVVTADDRGSIGKKTKDQPWSQVAVVSVRGFPSSGEISIRIDPWQLPADGKSTATVTATLPGRNAAGKTVRFFTTAGSISPASAVTDASGSARAALTAAAAPQTATVTASVDRMVARVPIEFVARAGRAVPAPSGGIVLQPQVAAIPADGATEVNILAVAYNAYGQLTPYGTVYFSTGNGTITNQVVADAYGRAVAVLRASYDPRPAVVTAWSGWRQGVTVVNFRPIALRMAAQPSQAPADGQSTITVSAIVTDIGNMPVADGTPVTFAAGRGALPGPARTSAGVASVTLTAPKEPGQATVTAQALGLTQAVGIEFTAAGAPPPGSPRISLAVSPAEIPADGGSTANVAAVVTRDGRPVVGQEVSFSTTDGAVTLHATTDENGVARAMLTSSITPAVAVITARHADAMDTVKVTFTKPGG